MLQSSLMLLFALGVFSNADKTHYVQTGVGEACLQEELQGCYPLSFYVQNTSYYFSSNTTFLFSTGNHVLDEDGFHLVQNIQYLSLMGTIGPDSATTISCSGSAGFAFMNVTYLHIASLTFINCGTEVTPYIWRITFSLYARNKAYQPGQGTQAALFMADVYNLRMSGVTVTNSSGYGLLAINVLGKAAVLNSMFSFNNFHTIWDDSCIDPILPPVEEESRALYLCEGGNAAFVYVDLRQCPDTMTSNSLMLDSCTFQFGANLVGPYVVGRYPREEMDLGGSGIVVLGEAVSYAIDIALFNITATHNIAQSKWRMVGANMNIVIWEAAHWDGSYKVFINRSLSSGAHQMRMQTTGEWGALEISFWYMYHLWYYGTPLSCPGLRTNEYQGRMDISQSHFSHSNGVGVVLLLFPLNIPTFTHKVTINNCTFENNTSSALWILEEKTQHNDYESRSEPNVYFSIVVYNSIFHNNLLLNYLSEQAVDKQMSAVMFAGVENVTFSNTTFTNNSGSALEIFDGNVFFKKSNVISGNTAVYGAGIGLRGNSFLYLRPDSHVHIFNNHAMRRGGGIHHSNIYSIYGWRMDWCFFRVESVSKYYPYVDKKYHLGITLENNTALEAGSALYGGIVDNCDVQLDLETYDSTDVFHSMFTIIKPQNSTVSAVASTPTLICYCKADLIEDCVSSADAGYTKSIKVHPGEQFTIRVILMGQRRGSVPAVIHSALMASIGHLGHLQDAQQLDAGCHNLTYEVYSFPEGEAYIFGWLESSGLAFDSEANFKLLVHVLPCPIGFAFSNKSLSCECAPILEQQNLTCDINDQTVQLKGSFWVGLQHDSDSNKSTIVLHAHCPFDYCIIRNIKLNLVRTDEQCSFNRTGILCGTCKPGLSLALATSQCLKCSYAYISLTVIFALAGIALVVLLIALNLTVSVGTINGLIFYANVVQVNQAIFFPLGSHLKIPNMILHIFIAWLNLDLGIEVCFFDGMDAFTKTWLQFLFPVYIWIIVGALIYLSRHYSTVVKLVGRNIVSVLATLFLLSYAKLQRTIITSLSFTYLLYEEGSSPAVWLYDGSIYFLQGKHIALLSVALLFGLFFILPFTLLLLLIPCLLARSSHPILSWVNNLMPLLDAYQGPFKDRFRYWAGLMLVIRNVLFVTFAVNTLGDPQINLLVILTVMFCLLALTWQLGSVYKNWAMNALETSFILNLAIICTWSLFHRGDPVSVNQSQATVTCTMIGVAFATFLFIAAYHVVIQMNKLELFTYPCRRQELAQPTVEEGSNMSIASPCETHQPPTVTYIDLSQLRESLLTD